MEQNLILTIFLAILLMGLVIAGLGIGMILTGRQRLRRGCGLTPNKNGKDNKDKKSTCPMCGEKKECEQPDDKCNE